MPSPKPIVNTQDAELTVVNRKDQAGRVCVFVRIGEDGMGHNIARVNTFRLTKDETTKLIKQLQAVLADA